MIGGSCRAREFSPKDRVAVTLVGTWRRVPPVPLAADVPAQLIARLVDGGVGGLAWWRLRHHAAHSARGLRPLREAYRQQAVVAAATVGRIGEAVTALRAAGVEPILIKGWASARYYAEPGLRPSSDIDLCVRPDQVPAARAALAPTRVSALVDLHAGIPDLPDRTWDQAFDRSELVPCGHTPVRALAPEDHLRLLCVHFVRHGGFRPLWLCDIAAAAEAMGPGFDWGIFQGGNRRLTDWVLCVLALARRLLDARLDHPAVLAAADRLPEWFTRTVLWHWTAGRQSPGALHHLRHPAAAARALNYRGLNPIRFVFRSGLSPYSRLPLPLIQLGSWAAFIPQRLRKSIARRLAPVDRQVHQPIASLALYRSPTESAPRSRLRTLLTRLLAFVVVLVVVRGTLFDVYRVPSGSMRPTLAEGDRIIVNHLAYGLRVPFAARPLATWAEPERGDVVVFRSPADGRTFVKRVMGLPGDQIDVGGASVQVPAGHYFVLGDNRGASVDSRWFGCVDGRRIVGRVVGVGHWPV